MDASKKIKIGEVIKYNLFRFNQFGKYYRYNGRKEVRVIDRFGHYTMVLGFNYSDPSTGREKTITVNCYVYPLTK